MESKPAWRGRDRQPLVVGVLVVFLAAATVVAYMFKIRAEHQRIKNKIVEELAALSSAKGPLTAGDFATLYPDPPPKQDAGKLLTPALEQLCVPNDVEQLPVLGSVRFPHSGASLDSNTQRAVEQLLATNRPALLAAEQTDLNGAWFATGFSRGFTNISNPPLRQVLSLARLFCLDATLKAEKQDGTGATRSLNQAFQLSKTCRSPVPIRQLSAWVMKGSGTVALERVLNCTGLSDSELDLLATAVSDEDGDGLRRIMEGERGLELSFFELFRSMATQLTSTARSPVSYMLAKRIVNERDFLSYLEWQQQQFALLGLSTRQQLGWIATNKPPSLDNRQRTTLAMLVIRSDTSRYFEGHASVLTTLRLARTALAIERWRLAHHDNLPDALAELMPAYLPTIPIDPFADQPLCYQKLARGYRVYSVGPDFKDDGGREKPPDAKENAHFDMTFTVER